MLNIKIICMHQYFESHGDVMTPLPLPFPLSIIKKRVESGKWTDPVYTFSFGVVECSEGTTFRALLDKIGASLEVQKIHFIRGHEAIPINKGDVDFPLCDEDMLHITDDFSLMKRFFPPSVKYTPIV